MPGQLRRKNRKPMNSSERLINEYAQGLISQEHLRAFFKSSTDSERQNILNSLHLLLINVKPTKQELELAISASRINRRSTPAVLLLQKQLNIAIPQILKLPPTEFANSLKLLAEVFKISDTRRRTEECGPYCHHEWHNL